MKKVYWIAGIVIIIILVYSFSSNTTEKPKDYPTKIMELRLKKDQYFRTAKDSPIKDKGSFKGLKYYVPDANYRVMATFTALTDKETLEIPTSKEKKDIYVKVGHASFELLGKQHKLLVLKKDINDKMLFIPFVDQTSGEETYGAGRYLDVAMASGNTSQITLDFNQAYSPYCAYNPDYVCPMPPLENNLEIAIKAGEKVAKEN